MEDKPYSVDSSDDINVDDDDEHTEENHSKCLCLSLNVSCGWVFFFL